MMETKLIIKGACQIDKLEPMIFMKSVTDLKTTSKSTKFLIGIFIKLVDVNGKYYIFQRSLYISSTKISQ